LVAVLTDPTLDERLRACALAIVERHRDDVQRNVDLVARALAGSVAPRGGA
jgi:hypothetical protein